jgi:DNA-binding HxlR family transcriptional regulator
MSKRAYDQYCGIAHALDLIGERWSLLIVRELLTGPKRFKDLMEGLSGISTNLLSKRLSHLKNQNILQKTKLPPPASTEAYTLTKRGKALKPVLMELGRWGLQTLGPPSKGETFKPHWLCLSLESLFDPTQAEHVDKTYQLRIDNRAICVSVTKGDISIEEREATSPDVVLDTDTEYFLALILNQQSWAEAKQKDAVQIRGKTEDLEEFSTFFDTSLLEREDT